MTETPVIEDETQVPSAEADANAEGVVSEVDTPASPEGGEAEVTNLNAFWAVVEQIDSATPVYTDSIAEYEKLTRKGKMQASHGVKAKTFAALDEDEYAKAKALSGLSKALGSSSSTGEATDPTEELVNRMAGFYIAFTTLKAANPTLEEKVAAAVQAATVQGEPDSEGKTTLTEDAAKTVAALLAAKLVDSKMGRRPRETGGTRHNVGKHISQIFAELPDGTFLSIKEIANAKSEEYGDDAPAVNTVATHLNSGKFEQAGLSVDTRGEGDAATLGVVKGVEA